MASPMQLQFLDSYPYRPLGPDLEKLLSRARRVDAAIAFITRPGIAMLRQYLKTHSSGSARLVASVRFPTDLPGLANLEEDHPSTVFLHTGFQTPFEEGADRGQFHSKVALLDLGGTERCVVLGSHNWTGNALNGYNMEAGIILHCQETDSIVAQVRQHIEACARRSEPFSRQRLRLYQTVQRDLHRRVGPGVTESEDFPGFESMDALVIHAEDSTGSGIPNPLQLFIPIQDSPARDFFPDRRHVLLYVYPKGSLMGHSPPTASPVAYEGYVSMTNTVQDAPAEGRPATCRISDLNRPCIDLLPSGVIPPSGSEIFQVVIRCDRQGRVDLPIFHTGPQPKMRLGVDYEVVDRDEGDREARLSPRAMEESRSQIAALPEYLAPNYLTLKAEIKVPNRDLYRVRIEHFLREFLFKSDLFEESTVPDLNIGTAAPAKMLNQLVYQVDYWLSRETIARVTKQLPLFPKT